MKYLYSRHVMLCFHALVLLCLVFSFGNSDEAQASVPVAATLVSPSGTTADNTPTYTWNAVSDSTWYYLWVDDSTGTRIKKWYTEEQAGCPGGTGQCSVTPTTELAEGSGKWWIQTWNDSGRGPWSAAMTVTINGAPEAATLVSPSGTTADNTPTYTWNAVSDSTWYYLWVDDSTGTRIKKWYTEEQAGCPGGTGQCSVTPTTELAEGSGKWWIQTWNDSGRGPWSAAMTVTINGAPEAATLVSPSGTTADNTPTYTWNAVSDSTWYYLWVDDSTGTRIKKWYTEEQAGCPGGTGQCSVTPTTELAEGSGKWWIQTWNDNGRGPWSSRIDFTVQSALSWSSPVAVVTESAPLDGLSPIDIDVDADGNWHAVYHLDYLSGDNEIMYLSSTSGTPVILAQSTVDESVAECAIAVDNTGGLHVMYRKRWGEPEQHSIMYLNNLGSGWSSPVAVVTESAPLDGLSPIDIDVDADGNWHAVYHLDYLSGDNEIMYLSSTSGTPVILAQSTVDESVAECAIAVDNTGGLHVMYRKRWGEPEQHSIMYLNNLGSGWSSPVAVVTESAPLDGLSPIDIDVDADGNWHAVYHLDYLSGDNEIMYLSSTSGTPVILAQSTVDESVAECAIAVDNTGGLHVMYRKRWGEPEQHSIMYMNTLGT